MEEVKSELNTGLSLEVATKKVNLGLQAANWEAISKEVADIEFSEENIPALRELKAKFGKVFKAIDAKHEELKRPYLTVCQNLDKAKTATYSIVNEVYAPFTKRFSDFCIKIENENKLKIAEENRKKQIRESIDNNVIYCSNVIAKATTKDELVKLNESIEKAKKDEKKFQEFLPDAVAAFEKIQVSLNAVIEHFDKQEKIAKKAAKATGNKRLTLEQQQQEAGDALEEAKISAQETALDTTMDASAIVPEAVITTVKPKRQTWKYEVKDPVIAYQAGLAKIVPDDEQIKKTLRDKKSEFDKGDDEEYLVDGVRYYLHKEY